MFRKPIVLVKVKNVSVYLVFAINLYCISIPILRIDITDIEELSVTCKQLREICLKVPYDTSTVIPIEHDGLSKLFYKVTRRAQ